MTDEERTLLRVYNGGQSVHVEGNVDHRPYRQLEDIGWLEGTALNLQEVSYRLTSEGLRRALDLSSSQTSL